MAFALRSGRQHALGKWRALACAQGRDGGREDRGLWVGGVWGSQGGRCLPPILGHVPSLPSCQVDCQRV